MSEEKEHNRLHIYRPDALDSLLADKLTSFTGSWSFLILHAVWFGLWIGLRVEPFPYGLLTMIVSLEAIALSTLVMMSQNRSYERDKARDDLEAEEVRLLVEVNQRQLDLLEAMHEQEKTPGEFRH